MGSSPLTRGKPRVLLMGRGHSGLIPAHAGKTTLTDAEQSAPAAHPRSRGENVSVSSGWEKVAGSSPLTRGKPYRPRRS